MGKQWGKKFFMVWVVLTLLALCAFGWVHQTSQKYNTRESLVDVNEVRQLTGGTKKEKEINRTLNRIEQTLQQKEKDSANQTAYQIIMICYVVVVLFTAGMFYRIHQKILHPFAKLNDFASSIAKGDFTKELNYERENYFGDFTWAFDNMRQEISKARLAEKEAIANNKTVIATISHDIKTPIASIRAYTEALQYHMDYDEERRKRYLSVIIRKCDEVTKLTNDLFLHSLSDLNKLKITNTKTDIGTIIEETITNLKGSSEIEIDGNVEHKEVLIDPQRMEQVMENIIANAKKYAPDSKITVQTYLTQEEYICKIRDYGEGILPEDLPFVFQKFYRGKNAKNKDGAGLGLYIIHYIMEQMNGRVLLENDHGLVVTVAIKIS